MNGLLTILILLVLKAMGKGGAQPTVKAEPQYVPPKAKPEIEIKVGPATLEPEPAPSKPAAHPAAAKVGPAPKVIPVSWPQAVPKDLPAWPKGWEPDVPVPAAEVTRATQLLPQLWKSGKAGGKVVEKTGDKWVTYLAFVPKKGKRGVAAYRIKPGAASSTVTI